MNTLSDTDTNKIIAHTIKASLIKFCHTKTHTGKSITQEEFDLLHDFRDCIINDLGVTINASPRG